MNRILLIGLIVFSVITQGCSTAYKGPKPNFENRAAEAILESKRFQLNPTPHFSRKLVVKMGDPGERYYLESLSDVISSVDPTINEELQSMQNLRNWQLGLAFVTLVSGVLMLIEDDEDTERIYRAMVLSFATVSVSVGIYGYSQYEGLLKVYNKKLEQKFVPKVGFNFQF